MFKKLKATKTYLQFRRSKQTNKHKAETHGQTQHLSSNRTHMHARTHKGTQTHTAFVLI